MSDNNSNIPTEQITALQDSTSKLLKAIIALFLLCAVSLSLTIVVLLTSDSSSQQDAVTNPGDLAAIVAEQMAIQKEAEQQAAIESRLSGYREVVTGDANPNSVYGNPSARFTLVEFSDLECGFCKRFHDTPKQVVDKYDGAVNWQWQHMPLDFHNPAAQVLAVASECVRELGGNQKFWGFLEGVFKRSAGNGQGVSDLPALIADYGVDPSKAQDCISSGRQFETVNAHLARADAMGVDSTPTSFIVDNQTGEYVMLRGAQPLQAVEATIERMIQISTSQENPQTGN
ncbi:DsbA family protein [uncultured Umboniibacter sp.]|uniref:DsbA family protein n=1 Tax=uncultured Umboniibacter sp. TaxID=1798917 RepID=UPI00261EDCD8|nr:DsbA family protein [uncultured Umboniibacter sp.]